MRRNKARSIAALITAMFMLNMVAFAQVDGVEAEYELTEVPNSLDEAAYDAEDEVAALSADVGIMAAEEETQAVAPGKVITYNGKTYRVKADATNVAAQLGHFDTQPNYATSGETDVLIFNGGATAWSYVTDDGHESNGCVELLSGTMIWRHNFDVGKTYVYSAWWKFNGDANLNSSQRHIEGCRDIDTGEPHRNEIGADGSNGRDITHDWQQDLCVFRGTSIERGLFLYVDKINDGSIYADDIVIYEVETIADIDEIGDAVIEEELAPGSWTTHNEIPAAGVPYNCVVSYSVNSTIPIKFNGVAVLFKDGKLFDIATTEVNSRTATITPDGDLISRSGAVSIPIMVPAGEDVSRFSCVVFLSDADNPFYVYGEATDSYAAAIYGAQ